MLARLAAAVAILIAGCSSTVVSPSSPPSTTRATAVAASPSPTVTTAAPPSPAPTGLDGCPPAVELSSLPPLVREPDDVDDVTVESDGDIWLTAVRAGRVLELGTAGNLLRTFDDPHGPEGIAVLPGGMLAVAEQAANRVVRLDPATGATTPMLDVPNRTANEGVDGIAVDAARARLLVPDSANGRLLALPLDGSSPAILATGLGRPVAAWAEADGSVDVGVENAPGLVRVGGDGRVTPLVGRGMLTRVDEVLGEGGLLYVTDLAGQDLVAIDPGTGATRRLVTGARDPQGLAMFADGRLLLVDSQSRELVLVPPCR